MATTLKAALWLFVPRILALLVWSNLPTATSANTITALCAVDAAALLAQLALIRRDAVNASGPGIAVLFRLAQIILAALTLTLLADRLADAHIGPPAEAVEQSQLPVTAQTVVFEGEITLHSFNKLRETLHINPDLTHLRLTSNGGNIPAARGMAKLVLDFDLSTQAAGICASACTLVFAAGKSRQLLANTRLGFHAIRLNTGAQLFDVKSEEQRDRKFLRQRGIAAAFIDQAFATPHSEMWFPDMATLRRSGVLRP